MVFSSNKRDLKCFSIRRKVRDVVKNEQYSIKSGILIRVLLKSGMLEVTEVLGQVPLRLFIKKVFHTSKSLGYSGNDRLLLHMKWKQHSIWIEAWDEIEALKLVPLEFLTEKHVWDIGIYIHICTRWIKMLLFPHMRTDLNPLPIWTDFVLFRKNKK